MAEYATPYPPGRTPALTRMRDRPTQGDRPALVGLVAHKRAGKDTVAARLVDRHGFTRYAFADPLKAAALALDPIVEWIPGLYDLPAPVRLSEMVGNDGWEAAKDRREVRRTLQQFGVGLRDTLGESVWLDYAMRRIDADPGPVVVTDVRFPNEADAIEARGGVLVRITRPGTDGDRHISETALDMRPVDYVLHNGGNLDDLTRLADWLAECV